MEKNNRSMNKEEREKDQRYVIHYRPGAVQEKTKGKENIAYP